MNQTNGTFRAYAASTGETVEPDFSVSTVEDVATACKAAAAAFDEYREIAADKRADFLEAIGDEIMALGDDLLKRAMLESGLPEARLTGERGRTVNQLKLFADVVRAGNWRGLRIDPAMPDRQPMPRPDLRLRMIPVGPVAVFGASNFPFAFSTAGGDTASALAAGCPVVIKGHPAHPGTDSMVAEAMQKAAEKTGMPDGVVTHLRGPGKELGQALVKDPRIAAVGFTGSRAGGLALAKLAQERDVPIPVFAEMSSVNPVVLMPEALKNNGGKLGEAFAGSLTMGAGQFCTNPGVVLAIKGEGLDAFEQAAAKALSEHKPQTMLTTGIRDAYSQDVAKVAKAPGIETLATGVEGDGKTCEAAYLFAADGSQVANQPELLNEMFGAASIVVRCENLEQMADLLETMEGQLTATLHLAGDDSSQAKALMPILERKAGRILVDGWPTGVEVAHAMVHGGPFPATTDGRTTSVGTLAIERFLRPVSYQNMPQELLPPELAGYEKLPHMLDGKLA